MYAKSYTFFFKCVIMEEKERMMEENFDVLTPLGEFTGEIASRDECHTQGLWHRAVFAFIINTKGEILLQQRSLNKKLWPNKWDVTVGGHVESGEFGRQALVRECKEELGIDVNDSDIRFLVSSTSVYNKEGYINNHYDECYLIFKDIELSELNLQEKEVADVRYFSKNEIIWRINNNYEGLTEKTVSWNICKKILESSYLNSIKLQ